MGADLYLETVNRPQRQKYEAKFDAAVAKRNALPPNSPAAKTAQKEVEKAYSAMYSNGYFRDCYNCFGLFANLEGDWSWWRDIVPLLSKRGSFLPVGEAVKLRDKLVKTPITLGPEVLDAAIGKKKSIPLRSPVQTAVLEEEIATKKLTAKEEALVAKTVKQYESFKQELVDILDLSIKLNEPIRCSL